MQYRPSTVCPILIGRERELDQLRAALDAAGSETGGCILLSGEAGIGKSRLLTELIADAKARGWVSVRAGCLESDIGQPFALAMQLAHALGGASLPFEDAPEAERQSRRVERALRDQIERVAGDRPLLLAADDLHWSDQPSLRALLGLAQRPGRTLLALTCRQESLQPALASFLAELSRLRLARDIEVRSLRRTEIARMIQAILAIGERVPDALLDEVMSATDGVPFLIEEVLRSLIESGGVEPDRNGWRRREGVPLRTPGSLRQAIEGRLLTQPPDVTRVAQLAAAIGQVPDLDVLRALCSLDEVALVHALRALVDTQILVALPDGRPAFRHALTRDAILARLLAPERQLLHRQVAESFERDPTTPAATLAYHWAQAKQLHIAGPHALRAARQAAAIHAHREAIGHYQLALVGTAGPDVELLTALGDQYTHLSECEAAVSHYRQAMQLCSGAGDRTRVAELTLRIGIAYADHRRRTEARRHLTAALDGLPLGHSDRWRAGRELARQLAAQGLYREAEAALSQARSDGSSAGPLARLLIEQELGGVLAVQGDWNALERAAEAIMAATSGDADDVLALQHDAQAVLGEIAYDRGDLPRSLMHHQACRELARQRGQIHDHALASWSVAMRLYAMGQWPEARAELAEAQSLGDSRIGELAPPFEYLLAGRREAEAACWLDVWDRFEADVDFEFLVAIARYGAEALLAIGGYGQVGARLETVLARIRAAGARTYEARLAACWVEALAHLDDPRAATACDATIDLARRLGSRRPEALALRARGWARRSAGAWDGAYADQAAALAIFDEIGIPYDAAQTLKQAGLSRLARGRRGDRQRATAMLEESRQRFATLGSSRDVADVTAILSKSGLLDRAPADGPLSSREREVADLVMVGLTNREIAERLFITEKTASHHISAILSKLGLGSRVELAAYVARRERQSSATAPHPEFGQDVRYS